MTDELAEKVNNPIDTDADPSPNAGARRLRNYWVHGPGAAKIGWGVPGDFLRCVGHLGKYVSDPKGLCNVYHRAALGVAPGQEKWDELDLELKKAYSSDALAKLGAKGQAFKNGNGEWSYPIANENDLRNAIQAFGRSSEGDRSRLKAYIERRARALGKSDLIPDKWSEKALSFDLELQETLLYANTLLKWSMEDLISLNDLNEIEDKDDMSVELEHKSLGDAGVSGGGVVSATDDGIVEAIVSVTGIVDNVGDIIVPGAYTKTLQERTPKGVSHHDWAIPVSKPLEVTEWMPGDANLPKTLANGQPWPAEAGALYVKAQFNLETQRGREAFSDAKFFGDQGEWSIGYKVPRGGATKDEKTGIRHIKDIQLFEYSPVLFGAASNARTLITAAKSLFDTEEEFLNEIKEITHIEVVEDTPQYIDPTKLVEGEVAKVEVVAPPADDPASVEEPKDSEKRLHHVEASLTAESMAQIKALHDQLGAVLAILTTKPEPEEYAFSGDKSLRSCVDALIDGAWDSGIVQGIDDNIIALEKAISAGDHHSIKSNADEALDEIDLALKDPKVDEKTKGELRDLVAAIGEAIKGIEDGLVQDAVDTADPTVDTSATDAPKTIDISDAEWKALLDI